MRIRKNESVAGSRTMALFVYNDDGPVEPTAVTVADLLYSPGDGACVAATGTLAPKTKLLVVADFTFTADATTDQLHAVAHTLKSCDGPFTMANAGGGLPGALAALTSYWIIPVDVDNFKIASSLANAIAGVAINITTNGTGVQTMSDAPTTRRCIRGAFEYTFTQAETNVTATHVSILIERADLHTLEQTADVYVRAFDLDGQVGGPTYGDMMRYKTGIVGGVATGFDGDNYGFLCPWTGKPRATGTVDDAGRPVVTPNPDLS